MGWLFIYPVSQNALLQPNTLSAARSEPIIFVVYLQIDMLAKYSWFDCFLNFHRESLCV